MAEKRISHIKKAYNGTVREGETRKRRLKRIGNYPVQYEKPSDEDFEELCELTGGNLTEIARQLGISRTTLHNWANKNPQWQIFLEQEREKVLDLTEHSAKLLIRGVPKVDENNNFIGWIERPDTTMITWYQKTLGRNRGFVVQQDINTKNINLNVNAELDELSNEELIKILTDVQETID